MFVGGSSEIMATLEWSWVLAVRLLLVVGGGGENMAGRGW